MTISLPRTDQMSPLGLCDPQRFQQCSKRVRRSCHQKPKQFLESQQFCTWCQIY
uniref:Uncharacterized protein n=1 Tax=Lotus japonicus TaxID=34305 RepID=I3RZ98_LOTJA|nr:unknown [Lotus japonicus]